MRNCFFFNKVCILSKSQCLVLRVLIVKTGSVLLFVREPMHPVTPLVFVILVLVVVVSKTPTACMMTVAKPTAPTPLPTLVAAP